jgi:hypothetical protein
MRNLTIRLLFITGIILLALWAKPNVYGDKNLGEVIEFSVEPQTSVDAVADPDIVAILESYRSQFGAPTGVRRYQMLVRATGKRIPCSPVRVGQHVLLTAAHCLEGYPDSRCSCYGDESCTGGTTGFPPHIDAWDIGPDIALCRITGTAQVETVSTDAPGAMVALELGVCTGTYCGQSINSASAAAHSVSATITSRAPPWWVAQAASTACNNDSGGPVFASSQVIGVVKGRCKGTSTSVNDIYFTPLHHSGVRNWMCEWKDKEPQLRKIKGLVCPT